MSIILSVRDFFRLSKALNPQIKIFRYSKTGIQCSFKISDVEFVSTRVHIHYVKKWCPLIMGENYYRNSFFYQL